MVMRKLAGMVVIVLTVAILTYGQGNVFKKVRYQGGSVASTVHHDECRTTRVVDSDKIKLTFRDGRNKVIDPKQVTGLSYGQDAHRRIGAMIALAVLVSPIALFGLLSKTRKHFVGIEWQEDGEKKGGVLLQADKNNYRGILMALGGVTGARALRLPSKIENTFRPAST